MFYYNWLFLLTILTAINPLCPETKDHHMYKQEIEFTPIVDCKSLHTTFF